MRDLNEYHTAADSLNTIWMLLNLKKVISRIDKKKNSRVTYHNALVALYTMKKGHEEFNSEYLEQFRLKIKNKKLTQTSNVFSSPALMKVEDACKPTDQKINDEEE